MQPEEEIWKDIPGYPHYQASNQGRVKRLACEDKRGWRLKEKILVVSVQRYCAAGYLHSFVSIGLGGGGKCECLSVGRAVLLAFEGSPPDPKMVCRHLDDDIRNNKLSNLKWGTQKENIHDAIRNKKRTTYGENVKQSKLKELDVLYIRNVYVEGCSMFGAEALAKKYNVCDYTIRNVIERISWKHI